MCMHVSAGALKVQKRAGLQIPGVAAKTVTSSPGLGTSSGVLQEQKLLLTAEPSLQAKCVFCLDRYIDFCVYFSNFGFQYMEMSLSALKGFSSHL